MSSKIDRREEVRRIVAWIGEEDPLDRRSVAGWSRSPDADRVLERILDAFVEFGPEPRSRSARRPTRLAVVLVATLVVGAGAAAASGVLFGGPAPEAVKNDLANTDQGMPPDLRENPDVRNAHLAAETDGAQLYAAALADGGYCLEIVTQESGPRGAVCTPSSTAAGEPIEITVPFVDPITLDSPIVVGGRVNAGAVTSLTATFADGSSQAVPLGDDGYFIFRVAPEHLRSTHLDGATLSAADASGQQIATGSVPPSDFTDPRDADRRQPIFVSTISTHDDFTKVLGVEGRVNLSGAATLELRYPDGTTVAVALDHEGRYHYDVPTARRGDLFDEPGWLIARDPSGNEIARARVAAVAYWRASG